MPTAGFEPTMLVGERPHPYALDHAVTETGFWARYACSKITIISISWTTSVVSDVSPLLDRYDCKAVIKQKKNLI
jgi:hypothetical protein